MAVEIQILSGARQGERLLLDSNEFRMGTDAGCDIFFDPLRDPGAKDRTAVFRLLEGGWHIQRTGVGELLVNQQPVRGQTHVRSGDLVRVSESGPDFCFRLVSHHGPLAKPAVKADALASGGGAEGAAIGKPEGAGIQGGAARSALPTVFPLTSDNAPLAELLVPAVAPLAFPGPPSAHGVPAPSPPESVRVWNNRPSVPPPFAGRESKLWLIWGVSGVAVCILLVFLLAVTAWLALRPTRTEVTEGGAPRTQAGEEGPAGKKAGGEGTVIETKKLSPASPPETVLQKLSGTVYLVERENTRRFWPYATCVAVGRRVLLTSAREACQLIVWRQDGSKIWAVDPVNNSRREIRDVFVSGLFIAGLEASAEPGKAPDWVYNDLALLTVDEDLPKTAALASRQDVANIQDGTPLTFVGIPHSGDKVTDRDKFEPAEFSGRVFSIPKTTSLRITATIPANLYGSPITNESGKIVGIYGGSASELCGKGSLDAGVKDLQVVSLLDNPELVLRRNEKPYAQLWVIPDAPEPSVQTKPQSPETKSAPATPPQTKPQP